MPHHHTPRRARLSLTALERRLTPATFTVLNADDAGAGSLRQAILDANALAGADIINFDPAFFATPRTITLTAASGQLLVNRECTIAGPGASLLTVSGGNAVRVFDIGDPTPSSTPVAISGLTVTGGNGSTGGPSPTPSFGGGIRVRGAYLTLDGVIVTNNISKVALPSLISGGGGVAVTSGFFAGLTLRNSLISGNVTDTFGGGVLFLNGGNLRVEGSTLVNNSADYGGGINFQGVVGNLGLTVRNSTISGNTAVGSGGGIDLYRLGGTAVVQNCTIADNAANTTRRSRTAGGGGIHARFAFMQAALTIQSSIVSGNLAAFGNGRSDIAADATVPVTVTASAVGDADGFTPTAASSGNLPFGTPLWLLPLADNGGPTPTHALAPVSPALDAGSNPANLTTDQRGPGFPRVAGAAADMGAVEGAIDLPAAIADLPAVTTAGAATYTFAVTYAGGTAIDVGTLGDGDVRVTGPNGYDQPATFVNVTPPDNGSPRTATYRVPAPGGGFDAADNGTYTASLAAGQVANVNGGTAPPLRLGQFAVAISQTFIVTNATDAGPGSLRQAVLDAEINPVADRIEFDPAFFGVPRTITLTSGQLLFRTSVTVAGPGAGLLTVSGGGTSRVFDALRLPGRVALDLTLSGMRITGGNGSTGGPTPMAGWGGGVRILGESLTLDNVVVTGNTAPTMFGGGVSASNYSMTVTVRNSTISGNSAATHGGGLHVYTQDAVILVENSTVAGNTAGGAGGGIRFEGRAGQPAQSLVVRNSTVSGNTAGTSGGGILAEYVNGTLSVQNSTVTSNAAGTADPARGGGRIALVPYSTSQPATALTLQSSIVSGNTAPAANGRPDIDDRVNATVTVTHSAIGDSAGFTLAAGSGNNLPFGTALGLLPLTDNGGPTQTHAFDAASPLRNAGSNPAALATDQRGPGFARVEGAAADIGAFEFQAVPPPRVVGVAVNPGSMQRSRVTRITVTFNTVVAFAGPVANAFGLSRIGGGAVGGFSAAANVVNGVTVVTLFGFSGAETEFGSLADGRYSVLVRADQVSVGGQQLDGNGDGTAGDDYTLAGTVANGLYRLYGDANGDGVINAFDFGQFRGAFGASTGQAAYLDWLDLNGDGTINAFDFAQFRTRFGSSVP